MPVSELVVSVEKILKGMEMKLTDADDYLLKLIDELTGQCFRMVQPQAGYVVYDDFSVVEQKIRIENKSFDTGKIVASFLKNSDALVLFSATCGADIEKYSKELMKSGHALEGLIVDLIGSELAESVVDYLHFQVGSKVGEVDAGVTNRFSPGYCNWPVSDQQQLFDLLKGNQSGIHLTPSSLMIPVKSVSGMIGIGYSVKRVEYKCQICDNKKCILRKIE